MNAIKWRFKPGFLAIAAVAALMLSTPWSLAEAQPGSGVDCGAQVDRAADALSSGDRIAAVQATKVEGCILSQPAQAADALAHDQTAGATQQPADAAPTVVASFSTFAGIPWCLDFDSDGTLAGRPLVPAVSGLGGGYLGTPGVFTLFLVTLNSSSGSAPIFVGVGIGPVVIGVPISPEIPIPFMVGYQTPSC